MDIYNLVVESNDIGRRIDLFICEKINNISRNNVQKLIENGNIIVNNKNIKSNYKLKIKDEIRIEIPDAIEVKILSEDIDIDILYEDEDIIVVNKPKGMVVHPAPGHYTGTLVNALMYHCKNNLSGINGILRPGIVHRIDKDTSGIIMVAKNDISHQFLAKQLSEHTITRKYNAIVFNKLKDDVGTINLPIGRHKDDRKKMCVRNTNSRNAITHYKVIEHIGKYDLIEAILETGRTHQIRVHMSHIGHPLLGDEVYGKRKQPFSTKGQVLHAKVLGFIHPRTKEYMEFETDLPEYFIKLIKKLKLVQIS